MKRFISVGIIALLVMLSVDVLSLSFTNSIIANSISAQTAYAESIDLTPDKPITKAAKLTKVTISPAKFTLAPGKTMQLKINKTPANASFLSKTEWESSNEEIATVDKYGKVTAKKEGIVQIRFGTWSKKDYSDYKYAYTICYVAKKAPSAKAFTMNDFKIIIDGKTVDFSLTYNQTKKLFPGGEDDKNFDTKYMSYTVNETNYWCNFLFKKTGDGNRKLLGAMCFYNGEGASVKTPRGIKLGSSSIVDVVNTYGYPAFCGDGNSLSYEVKISKDRYVLDIYGNSEAFSAPVNTIYMIGIAKNTTLDQN